MSSILTPRDQEMACYVWQSMNDIPEVSCILFVAVHASSSYDSTLWPYSRLPRSLSFYATRCELVHATVVFLCRCLAFSRFALRVDSRCICLSHEPLSLHIARCESVQAATILLSRDLPLHTARCDFAHASTTPLSRSPFPGHSTLRLLSRSHCIFLTCDSFTHCAL